MIKRIIKGQTVVRRNIGFKDVDELTPAWDVLPVPYDLDKIKKGDRVLIEAVVCVNKATNQFQLVIPKSTNFKNIITKITKKDISC